MKMQNNKSRMEKRIQGFKGNNNEKPEFRIRKPNKLGNYKDEL